MKKPVIVDEARSEKDHEALVEAYLALEEKDKVQILKNLKKHAPPMLQRIIRKAGLPGGVSQQRVIARFGRNGRIIDNWLKAREQRVFFAQTIYGWLENLPDELKSIYDLFENATHEQECIKIVEKYLNEIRHDAMAVLRGRFALAWLNFDNVLEFNKVVEKIYNEDIEKETNELNAQILLDELEKKSSVLIELAGEVAGGLSWNEERWQTSLKSAKETVGKIRSEVEKRSELLGEELPVWNDRQGLESVLKHLEREIEKQKGNEKTSKFLRDLANEIRQLVPIQRLAQKRQKHALLRDAASSELELAAETAPSNWKAEGPLQKGKWLDWASEISGQELEKLLSVLNDSGFPKTAELLEDLEVFDRNANTNAETNSKTSCLADLGQDQASQSPLEGDTSTPKEPPVESIEVLKQPDDLSVAPLLTIVSKSLPSSTEALETQKELVLTKNPQECEAVIEKKHTENQKTLEQRKVFSSVEEAAEAVARASDADIEACVEGLIWYLLKCGERMIAWQTLKCAVEEKGMTRAFPVSPQILEILALMPVYAEGTTEVFERVRACLPTQPDKIFVENQRQENIVRRLFLSASCFLPALLDKISNASTSLTEISLGRAGSIRHLQKDTLEFASGTVEINQSILHATLNQQGWQEQLEDLKSKLEEFRSQVVYRKINYAPARQIWVQWFNPDALLHRLFCHALEVDRMGINDLSLELNSIDIENEIEKAWKEYRGKGELIGTARDQLRRYAEDAKKLVRGVIDHCEMHGQFENDYRRKLVRQIVDSFQKHLPKAIGDLQEYTTKEFGEDDWGKISFELLKAELERAGAFLSGKKNELACDDLEIWEGSDFARIDSSNMEIRLIPFGSVASRNSWSFNALVQGLSNPLLGWEEALSLSLRNEDHQTARLVLDRMFLENSDTEGLEKEKKECFDIAVARVKRALGTTEDKLGEALTKGWITAQVHQNLSDEVQNYSILLHSDEIKDYPFNQWHQKLEKIAIQILSHHTDEVRKIRERIDLLKAGSKEEHATIKDVLNGGDINLATDYLTQIEEEGALHPRSDQSRGAHFTEFFASTNGNAPLAEKIHEMLVDKNINSMELVKQIAEGEEIFGRILEEGHRSETSVALQTWMQISRSRNFEPSSVLKLIKAFGFPAKGIHEERDKPLVINLEKTVFCPVPDFGSVLGGQFITLCDVSSTSAESAIDRVSSSNFASKPVLLLWFKAVDSSTRRTFARICHEKAHKILLVDSVLALHVLLNTDSRLRTLFDCSLPFTSITPYSTTGGALAEEMFVGRRHEIRAIESDAPSGACFVYGGRQIGKSVLLRKVAKDFDDKTGKRIALYIDLTRHTVGTRETMEDVWRIMAEELGKRDPSIFKGSNPYKVTPKSFIASVVAWLHQDAARRILLLLDESDALLTADGENEIGNQHFDICNKIRGLMAETERRFKVVFAGLHNVQRTTMVANNPLAQLGRPICIGPLMQNGEAREAFRLIEQPFVAAGVTFESHHVINGILARTNYYPNLIQIVCSSLLSKVVDRQLRSDPKGTPPYTVNSRDVEDAFNNPELRAELRKKFLLTLDLDKRYQLIAYIVAFNRKEKEEGMTSVEIHSDAKCYWEKGFSLEPRASADVENEMFLVLLEEMCGLGILRQPRFGIFCLRSPNVAELLGTDAELERVLETAHLWEVTEPYAPETFRSVISHKFHWRSPLTSKQETILEQAEPPVIVIAGCKASGLEDLENRVKEKFRGGYLIYLQHVNSIDDFTKSVQELSKCKEGGKTILYVTASCDWNFEWVEKALQRVAKLTSNGRAVGVVFVADADKVWQLGGDWRKVASKVGTGYFQLRQWSRSVLKAFLKDGGNILNTAENVNAIAKATGLWAGALNVFHETLATGSWQDTWLTDGTLMDMIRSANSIEGLFGIKPDDRRLVLQELADAGDCDQVILSQYLSGTRQITSEVVAKVMEWAAVLSIVSLRDEKLCLDPFVKSMIQFSKNDFEKQA